MTKPRTPKPGTPTPATTPKGGQIDAIADALADCVAYLRARMERTHTPRNE